MFVSYQKQIIYEYGICCAVILVIAFTVWSLNFLRFSIFTKKEIQFMINYFNLLIKENKLIPDLKKYPVIFVMAFYYDKTWQFPIDYPNTYPRFVPYGAIYGLAIFFDKLYDYINKNDIENKI